MVSRAEKSHVTPFFLCFALFRSPFGTKNDHRRARCAVHQQSQNVTPTRYSAPTVEGARAVGIECLITFLLMIVFMASVTERQRKGERHFFAWLGQSHSRCERCDEADRACIVVAIPCGRHALSPRSLQQCDAHGGANYC